MTGISAQGSVIIHSAPRALVPHIEWAIGRLLGGPITIHWMPQPLAPGSLRANYSWQSDESFGASLASELIGWGAIRFEIIQDQALQADGWRWAYTPRLGLFQSQMDSLGSALVTEHRMRAILEEPTVSLADLHSKFLAAIGQPWDEELENFRVAGADAPVIWLQSV